MFKRLIDKLFGTKLPCGCTNKRYRRKLGDRVVCPVCGRSWTLMRFICDKPRSHGTITNVGMID